MSSKYDYIVVKDYNGSRVSRSTYINTESKVKNIDIESININNRDIVRHHFDEIFLTLKYIDFYTCVKVNK